MKKIRRKWYGISWLLSHCKLIWEKPWEENPWPILENNKYDLRIIIVIICPWYLLKNPCGENRRYDMYMSKIPPYKNPGGENKRYDIWTCIDIASLKTFYEKHVWEKTHRGKEYNMMFWTGYSFKRSLPLNLATLKIIAYQFQQHIVKCGNW